MNITCTHRINTAIADTQTVLDRTSGYQSVAFLAMAIFGLIEHVAKQVPAPLLKFSESVQNFIDLTSIVGVVRRLKTWTSANSKGKMAWQQEWYNVLGTASLTAFSTVSFVKYLNKLTVINLGKALNPLTKFGHLSLISMAICDLWDTRKTVPQQRTQITVMKGKWADTLIASKGNDWQRYVQGKIDALNKSKSEKETSELSLKRQMKIHKWEVLAKCNSQAVENYCTRKMDKWNEHVEQLRDKTIASIAFNVSLIALLTFVLFSGPILPILLLDLAVCTFDVKSAILDNCVPKPKEPALPSPAVQAAHS